MVTQTKLSPCEINFRLLSNNSANKGARLLCARPLCNRQRGVWTTERHKDGYSYHACLCLLNVAINVAEASAHDVIQCFLVYADLSKLFRYHVVATIRQRSAGVRGTLASLSRRTGRRRHLCEGERHVCVGDGRATCLLPGLCGRL